MIGRFFYFNNTKEVALPIDTTNHLLDSKKIVKDVVVDKDQEGIIQDMFIAPRVLSLPVLFIPSLGIKAHIQDVGVTNLGNMATPSNAYDVGLYVYGSTLGAYGSSVIAGHVNNRFGLKAVFGDLHKIKVGDDIYVQIDKATEMHFVVLYTSVYDYDAYVPEVFTKDDKQYLNLITCTGTWLSEAHTHDKRLVVTSVLSTD